MISDVGFDVDVNIDYEMFERLIVDDFIVNLNPSPTKSCP